MNARLPLIIFAALVVLLGIGLILKLETFIIDPQGLFR
jgi:hypothetical protein